MNKDHVKGAADKAKGAVKNAAGGLTGDKKLQAEGKLDKAKGAVHSTVGNAKDAVKRLSRTEADHLQAKESRLCGLSCFLGVG